MIRRKEMCAMASSRDLPDLPDPSNALVTTDVDELIERAEDLLGGASVFAGTRVPVQTLLDYLEAGDRLDDFLADFPTVRREQAVQVLALAGRALLARVD